MNTKRIPNYQEYKYETIYSLRIRTALREKGFEPVAEMKNPYKEWLKCWRYVVTPEFEKTLYEIMTGGQQE